MRHDDPYGEHETGASGTTHLCTDNINALSSEHNQIQPQVAGKNVKSRRNSLDITFDMNSAFKKLTENVTAQHEQEQAESQPELSENSPGPATESVHSFSGYSPAFRKKARHRRTQAISKRGCSPYARSIRNRPIRPALQITIPNERIFLDKHGYEQIVPLENNLEIVTHETSPRKSTEDKDVMPPREHQKQRHVDDDLSEQLAALANDLKSIRTSTQLAPDGIEEPEEEVKDMDVD